MRDVFVRELAFRIAAERPEVMLLTADLGFGVLDDFARRFPAQFLNVGVAEQNMTGLATGLALEGRIVFTYFVGQFPDRCAAIRTDPQRSRLLSRRQRCKIFMRWAAA